MREKELRAVAKCANCGKPFLHANVPFFWQVTIEHHGVLVRQIQRQDGLGQFLGNSELARIMGPDDEMTMPVMKPKKITLCDPCALEPVTIAILAEGNDEAQEAA